MLRGWYVPVGLLVGCGLFFSNVYPFNVDAGILQGADLRGYTYPYFDFIAREVHVGREIPLWNPHQLAGFSIIGAGEVNIFYPFNWLTVLWDVRKAITVNAMLHVFIGMWGVAFCARQLGASQLGSLVGGLIWGGSGLIGARLNAGHYTLILPMAWFPWVMGGYLWALKRGTWAAGLGAAGAMGLLHLAGHPQVAFLAGFMLLSIWGFAVADVPFGSRFGSATRPLLTIVVFGTMLGAIDISPVIETAWVSDRNIQQDRFEFAHRYSLPANQLVTFVFPYALGGEGTVRGDPNFEELFAYVGLLPLIAAVLLLQRPTTEVWLLLVLLGVGILLSLAMNGGVLRLLIQLVPQMGVFRSAGRWLSLTQMALACLTGLWITRLQNSTQEERRRSLSGLTRRELPTLIMLFFLLAFGLSLLRASSSSFLDSPDQIWNVAQIVAKAGVMLLLLELALLAVQTARLAFYQALGVLIGIALVDLWSVTLPLIPVGKPDIYGGFWQSLGSVVSPEDAGLSRIMVDQRRQRTLTSATGLGYYDIYGYEQLVADDYNRWIEDTDPLLLRNRLLGVRFVVTRGPLDEEILEKGLKPLREDENARLYVYEFTDPVPRAFLAKAVVVQPDDEGVRGFFADEVLARPEIVMVDRAMPCHQDRYVGGQVEITEYRPNRVRLRVESEGEGVLFLSDRYATGWRAEVNGQPSRIYRADTVFRAVCVPSGHSEVVFSYHPLSLYIGGLLSGGAWGLLLVLVGYRWFMRGKLHGA